jgi:hypothetical protein
MTMQLLALALAASAVALVGGAELRVADLSPAHGAAVRARVARAAAVRASPAASRAAADIEGTYFINSSALAQTMLGIGLEIQSDSIGSGNDGLPLSNSSVPWELVPSERARLATDVVAGFRLIRLALGL